MKHEGHAIAREGGAAVADVADRVETAERTP
jgi:hypothetical protein